MLERWVGKALFTSLLWFFFYCSHNEKHDCKTIKHYSNIVYLQVLCSLLPPFALSHHVLWMGQVTAKADNGLSVFLTMEILLLIIHKLSLCPAQQAAVASQTLTPSLKHAATTLWVTSDSHSFGQRLSLAWAIMTRCFLWEWNWSSNSYSGF